jgi:DNA topoisomerase VI subunit B
VLVLLKIEQKQSVKIKKNSFEADATTVVVEQLGSELSDAIAIKISDNGTGIPYSTLPNTIGAFLSSSKAVTSIKIRSQTNKGKGRFSYVAFTSLANWGDCF